MNTLTIQAGNTDDKLTQSQWSAFVHSMDEKIKEYVYEIHFFGGSPNWHPWQNVAWVVVSDKNLTLQLKAHLQVIRETYNQDSIAITTGVTELI